jgi:threonine/homoserine/homoserine lactone efflux protein
MTELLAFVGVAAVVIVTPGQDTALTIRNTVLGGRGAGVRTAAGVVCGQAVWALAAAAGVAALVVASEPAFTAVKLAGAAYLVACCPSSPTRSPPCWRTACCSAR